MNKIIIRNINRKFSNDYMIAVLYNHQLETQKIKG